MPGDNQNQTIEHETAPLKRQDLVQRDGLERLQPHITGDVPMGRRRGGASFENMLQVMEFAKIMATGGAGVPPEFRGNAGLCLRVAVQADEWGMSAFAVADDSYVVNGRLAYGSKLIHALIEKFGGLQRKLQMSFAGDGAEMTCTVTATVVGEPDPITYTSPKIREIKVKNSPLWVEDPKRQLFYYASRALARMHFPEVLLGVYARDEMPDEHQRGGADNAKIMGTVVDRLPGPSAAPRDGFDPNNINKALEPAGGGEKTEPETGAAEESPAETAPKTEKEKKPKPRKGAATAKDAPASKEEVQTAEQYVAYAESYIDNALDADDLGEQWKKERDLREKLGVKGKMRLALETKLDAKVQALSNA